MVVCVSLYFLLLANFPLTVINDPHHVSTPTFLHQVRVPQATWSAESVLLCDLLGGCFLSSFSPFFCFGLHKWNSRWKGVRGLLSLTGVMHRHYGHLRQKAWWTGGRNGEGEMGERPNYSNELIFCLMLESLSFILVHPERSGPAVLTGLKIILWHCVLIKGPPDINTLSEKWTCSVHHSEINTLLSLIGHFTRVTDFCSHLCRTATTSTERKALWAKAWSVPLLGFGSNSANVYSYRFI